MCKLHILLHIFLDINNIYKYYIYYIFTYIVYKNFVFLELEITENSVQLFSILAAAIRFYSYCHVRAQLENWQNPPRKVAHDTQVHLSQVSFSPGSWPLNPGCQNCY